MKSRQRDTNRAEQVTNPENGMTTNTDSGSRMGEISSGAKVWLRCGHVLSRPAKGLFRLFFALTLVATVFLATGLPAPAADYHAEAAAGQASNDLHDKVPCDEGFVCSAYVLSEGLGNGVSDTEYQRLLISSQMPFRHFMTPQVDLPPPRTSA